MANEVASSLSEADKCLPHVGPVTRPRVSGRKKVPKGREREVYPVPVTSLHNLPSDR
jgi:hypothetical protein